MKKLICSRKDCFRKGTLCCAVCKENDLCDGRCANAKEKECIYRRRDK